MINRERRYLLKGLADAIDNVHYAQFGKKMTYNVGQTTREVNHFRRLRREMSKNGTEGVIEYLRKWGFKPDVDRLRKELK